MREGLYTVNVKCPVCLKEIEVIKVRVGAGKIVSTDADFCVYYEGVNPILYDAWICGSCGYAAMSAEFNDISSKERDVIQEKVSSKWRQRTFAAERDLESALQAYKLVLYNLKVMDKKASSIARTCHRIAWIYRYMGNEDENVFLKHAVDKYCEAFENEEFPIGKMDEYNCMFIIGELFRRLHDYEKATTWFSRIISSPEARQNSRLMELVREQYALVKEKRTH